MKQNNENMFMSIEIGGTKQQIAIGYADGTIVSSRQVKLGSHAVATDILNWLHTNIEEILADTQVHGIGIGYGGPVELIRGRVIQSMQISGWKDFELRSWAEKEFKIKTNVLNDTACGGLGELTNGSGKGSRRMFYSNIGTGIGGSFYVDGRYDAGLGYGCSEIGHTWIPDWTVMTPGAKTQLEDICSGLNIERRLNTHDVIPKSSSLYDIYREIGYITCKELAQEAIRGDVFCLDEIDRIASSYATALSSMIALVAPDRIVIGGGVAKMGDVFIERIRKHTEEYCFEPCKGRYEIVVGTLTDNAVLVGGLIEAAID